MRRSEEATAVLDHAIATRPDDGSLRLRAGAMIVAWGGDDRSRGLEWMQASRSKVSELSWLRKTAETSAFLGDRALAIRCWQGVLKIQPHSADAWRGLARMTAEDQGEEASIALLDRATTEHPDIVAIWALNAEWLAGTKRGPLEALDRLIQLDPRDRWARRERALRRMEIHDGAGAEEDAREAVSLDPWEPESHGILGSILEDLGRTGEAIAAMRKALELRIDYIFAARGLVGMAEGRDEEIAAIRFIESEMRRQVSNGGILLTYQLLATSRIEPPLLLHQLQDFCAERPDLWQTWSARIEQALRMHMDGEALQAATTLTNSFPLLPRAWLDLAQVHRAAGRHEEEEQAAARATALSPGWDEAARTHAAVLELLGRPEDAITVLKRACRLDPLNGPNHGCLADCLRRNGHHRDAFDGLRAALLLCQQYQWGWETLANWSITDDRSQEIADDLRKASEINGHNASWWGTANEVWKLLDEPDEALQAICNGLELAPESPTLRDLLALQHFSAQRFDEALAACDPVAGEKSAPTNLQGRRAWILIHSGQPLRGVEAMKALLEREPDYSWGLGELAEWYYEREEWQPLRDICRQWLHVSNEVRILRILGRAQRELGNHPAAQQALAHAHALDPENVFATRQLLDLQMIAGDLDAAAITLARLEHYAKGPFVTCDGIELELKRNDLEAALRRAETLLADPSADADTFQCVSELFAGNRKKTVWSAWLAKKVKASPVAAPGALCAFLENLPSKHKLRKARKWIKREAPGSENRIAAWLWWIGYLNREKALNPIKNLAKSNNPELKQDGRIWNLLGEALLTVDAAKEGVRWLSDWREREADVNNATLLNLSALLDSCPGQEGPLWNQAIEVRREAFGRFPDSSSSQSNRAAYALDLAARGDCEQARQLLQDFEENKTAGYYRALAQLAQAVVAAESGDESRAKAELSNALLYLGKYSDLGCIRTRARAEVAIASHLAWTKGKPKRLRKKWGLSTPRNAHKPFYDREVKSPLWLIVLIIIVLVRGCLLVIEK